MKYLLFGLFIFAVLSGKYDKYFFLSFFVLVVLSRLYSKNSGRLQLLKFIYSAKATKFCEISTLLLTSTTQDKSKVEISQNVVSLSEHMNFTLKYSQEISNHSTILTFQAAKGYLKIARYVQIDGVGPNIQLQTDYLASVVLEVTDIVVLPTDGVVPRLMKTFWERNIANVPTAQISDLKHRNKKLNKVSIFSNLFF